MKVKAHAIYKTFLAILLLFGRSYLPACAQQGGENFESWAKLHNEIPEWFLDAKFGIYFHWGVYAVPAFNSEWYSRGMYVPGSKANVHHVATYGPVESFGYKDFIPAFTAEHFNPDEWADLFLRAGARFAGPVAEHADGFSMWDSQVNPWNSKNMGPQRDVVKEMENAIRKHKLKFITTFHHQWLWGWYPTFDEQVDAGRKQYAAFYGPLVSEEAWQHQPEAEKPDDAFSNQWLAKVKEVIESYQPDILYFDSRLGHIPEPYRKAMVSTYLEQTKKHKKEGIILYKHHDLPEHVGVRTHEKTRINTVGEKPWLTEEPISTYGWCYTEDMELRSAKDILHSLIDIVSKNGVYLLNISPKADGTIPKDQQKILLALGEWLKQNGEAIYSTRPWLTYGEGPAIEAAEKGEKKKYFELTYASEDIRYTHKDNNIYAILLGTPVAKNIIRLKSFATDVIPEKLSVSRISVLNTGEALHWEYQENGLTIKPPTQPGQQLATVLKIETIGR